MYNIKNNISISLLNVDNVDKYLNNLQKLVEYMDKKLKSKIGVIVHFDVMDNKFVPNTGVEIEKIKNVKKYGFYADVHLMVEKPLEDGYIEKSVLYGADRIIIHEEINNFEKNFNKLIDVKDKLEKQNRKLEIGIAIKPNTSIKNLENYIDKTDIILVMSVEPGFGGQKYIESVNDKIIKLKSKCEKIRLEVDGGVNFDTIVFPIRYGINDFVIGSYLTKCSNSEVSNRFIQLNMLFDIESLPKDANIEFDKKLLMIREDGYGKGDILIGVRVPIMRKCAKNWSFIDTHLLKAFIISKYHDYRRFAVFVLENKVKVIENKCEAGIILDFFEENIEYINNWDLTDISGPNIFSKCICFFDEDYIDKKVNEYISSENLWKKRIGIVCLLKFARDGKYEFVIKYCDRVIYEKFHLYQKATGWVLRELYKVFPDKVVSYLKENNMVKKLPSILLSYACEKMSDKEKKCIKGVE